MKILLSLQSFAVAALVECFVNLGSLVLFYNDPMIPFALPDPEHDDGPFVQLIADHQNVIRNFIISLLPGAPGVDDVFQNTNAVIWKKRESFEMDTNFRAWVLSIARFQAMAHLQQLRRRRWVSLDPDVAELIADDVEGNLARSVACWVRAGSKTLTKDTNSTLLAWDLPSEFGTKWRLTIDRTGDLFEFVIFGDGTTYDPAPVASA